MENERMVAFPYSGSGGKGDTWDGIIEVDLSDADYSRVERSIKNGCCHMAEDSTISDIYQHIYEKIIDTTLEAEKKYGMIDEYRSDFELPYDAAEREVIETFLDNQGCRINYPQILQQKYWESGET